MDKMTEKDWDEIDYSSRTVVSCLLLRVGATDVGESRGNCCWDLSCCINGRSIGCEIKDRSFPHDRFNDIMVEDIKQECNLRRIAKNEFAAVLAVNVFTDNVIAVANINDKDAKHFRKKAPYTTLVKGADHSYVYKDFVSLPQRKKYRFEKIEGKITFKKERNI